MKLLHYRREEVEDCNVNTTNNKMAYHQLKHKAKKEGFLFDLTYIEYTDLWLTEPSKFANKGLGRDKHRLIRKVAEDGYTKDNMIISNVGGCNKQRIGQTARNKCQNIRRRYEEFKGFTSIELYNMNIYDMCNTSGNLHQAKDPNVAYDLTHVYCTQQRKTGE